MRDDAPSEGLRITSLDVVRGASTGEIPADGVDSSRRALVVKIAEPSPAQLEAASERLATLIADLWMRGLLSDDGDQ